MLQIIIISLLIGAACGGFVFWFTTRPRSRGDTISPGQRDGGAVWHDARWLQAPIRSLSHAAERTPFISRNGSVFERLLADARWPHQVSRSKLMALGLASGIGSCLIMTLLVATLFTPIISILALLTIPLCFLAITKYWEDLIARRNETIHLDFPYAVDLLTLSVGAGSSLLLGIETVANTYRSHAIGEEFHHLCTDIKLGASHRTAFETFAKRVLLPEVKLFTTEVIQAENLGSPVRDTLRRLAQSLRTRRVQEANDKAGKAKVKIIVPSGLVFVSVLLIVLSPMILKALQGGYSM